MPEMTTMTGRDYYLTTGYDELPEAVRIEMRRVFDTGVNNSGVWVRFKEVENLAGVMAYQYTHRPVATNADRIRAMSDEELKALFCEVAGDCPQCKFSELGCMALDWLQSPAGGECEQSDADDNRTRDYWEETEDVDKYFS